MHNLLDLPLSLAWPLAIVVAVLGCIGGAIWQTLRWGARLRDQQRTQQQLQFELEAELRLSRQRIADMSSQQSQSDSEVAGLQAQLREALQQRDVAMTRAEEVTLLRSALADRDQRVESLQQQAAQLQAELAVSRSEFEQSRRASEDKLRLLHDAREQLAREFEALAQRIFDEKSARFSAQNQASLEGTLTPLRQQLGEFRKRIDDVYDRESRDRSSLRAELNQLKDLNQRMSQEALNLTRALKGDNRVQGNWGEVVLERVLEESGLRKGHEYETQFSVTGDDGRRRRPDVIVRLPDAKDIVIDAKCSLVDYERYCNAADETARRLALQAHITALRGHVDGLSARTYADLPGLRSLDFVLIFVPIEAAFLAAFEHEPALFRDCYDKNIIIVSPTTLLATLRTVESIWRYERQNANAERIARDAGRLHDQFARVMESLQELGRQLGKAGDAYELTLNRFSRGRGNLVKRVSDLARLGAKTQRKLPAELLEVAGALTDDDAADDAVADGEDAVTDDEKTSQESSRQRRKLDAASDLSLS